VVGSECRGQSPDGYCDPTKPVAIKFSVEVPYSEPKRISFSPDPEATLIDTCYDCFTNDSFLYRARFQPATTYSVRIPGSVVDDYGRTLGPDEVLTVRFGNLHPTIYIGAKGTKFEPSNAQAVAIHSLNIGAYDVVTAKLNEESVQRFLATSFLTFHQVAELPGAVSTKVHPTAAVNSTAVHPIRTEEILGGPTQQGPLAVAFRYDPAPGTPDSEPISEARVIQVTSLGVVRKTSAAGSVVWITRLSDGSPVSGAEVCVRKPGGRPRDDTVYRTDPDGLATIAAPIFTSADDVSDREETKETHPFIVVRHGNELAFDDGANAIHARPPAWRYAAGTRPTVGMLFADRSVYRPGDTAHLKGVFRQLAPNGSTIPAGKRVKVTIDHEPLEIDLRVSEFGTVAFDLGIARCGLLGELHVAAQLEGAEEPIDHTLNVEDSDADVLSVTAQLDRPHYFNGDSIACAATVRDIVNATPIGSSVHFSVKHSRSSYTVPLTEGFVASDRSYSHPREARGWSVLDAKGTINDQGWAEARGKLDLTELDSARDIECEASLWRSSGTVQSTAVSQVHPSEFYVAIRSGIEGFAQSGTGISPQVMVLDPQGIPQQGTPVQIDLIQAHYRSDRFGHGPDRGVQDRTKKDTTVAQCDVRSAADPVGCSLFVPSAGVYVVRAKATDRRGNKVAASTEFYATGAVEEGWTYHDNPLVELVSDRETYNIGQTANILVKSPFDKSEALVTVERAGAASGRRLALSGHGPTIQIPITAEMYPNAHVSVVLQRGRLGVPPTVGESPDLSAPSFRLGFASLRVNHEVKRLKVDVKTDRSEYRPGEQISVELQVKNGAGQGQRAEVMLMADVDGVARHIRDPVATLQLPRPLMARFADSRSDVGRALGRSFARRQRLLHWERPPYERYDYDTGFESYRPYYSEPEVRETEAFLPFGPDSTLPTWRNQRKASYFPAIVTNDSGVARTTFKLPTGSGAFRLLVLAVGTGDQYGVGDRPLTTRSPLIANASMPNFLRPGDETEATLMLTSASAATTNVDVRATVEGAKLVGQTEQKMELDGGKATHLRFRIRAEKPGDVKLWFAVQAGDERTVADTASKVQDTQIMEAVVHEGKIESAAAITLGDMAAIRDDKSEITISFGAETSQDERENESLLWFAALDQPDADLSDAEDSSAEPETQATVWLGEEQVLQQAIRLLSSAPEAIKISSAEIAKASGKVLAIELGGNDKAVPYRVLFEYARREWPTEPLDRGFTVQKVMRVLGPESNLDDLGTIPWMSHELPSPRQGDMVVVDILMVALHPTQSAYGEDPVPAGLDVMSYDRGGIRESLATTRPPNSYWGRTSVGDRVVMSHANNQSAGLFHFRYLARAVTPGRYLIPPTRFLSRTHPEIFGRTGVSYMTVRPREGSP